MRHDQLDTTCSSVRAEVLVEYHGLTDVGKVRRENQDQFLIAEMKKSVEIHGTSLARAADEPDEKRGYLFLVADGIGGHAGGRRASAIAVDAIVHYMLNVMHLDIQDELDSILEKCHSAVRLAAASTSEYRRMGTTLTIAYVLWPRLCVAHAGDSRCYLLRHSWFECMTTDHTLARRLVDDDAARPDPSMLRRGRHILWKSLGGGHERLEAETSRAKLEVGDTVLLCTDGLTRHVGDSEIASILGEASSAGSAAQSLIACANAAGGADNVTVVVAKFY